MTVTVAVPDRVTEDRITVTCPGCGATRRVTVRQRRRMENEGADRRCLICRSHQRDPVVEQRHRNFWLDTYSIEWIKDTAAMIWGPK